MFYDDACVSVRFGGEEFVVLLPDCDQQQSLMVADYLRTTIESLRFSSEAAGSDLYSGECQTSTAVSGDFKVTVSIGVAAGVPRLSVDQNGLALLDKADRALYGAKEAGRNCCFLYHPGAISPSQRRAA